MTVKELAKEAAERFSMFDKTDGIVAALSGGADSVCLALMLKELAAEYGFSLRAVHVNHLLRGDESDRDERFCREFCEKQGIELTVFRRDAAEYAKRHGASVEEGARKMRYELLYSALKDGEKVAAAHTLSDSAETVLFNFSRGTGLKGLFGIPPVRDKIIRPLIYCKREDILVYLSEKEQDFVTDSTNLCCDYSRNKIRLRVIPVLKEINSGFFESVRRMTDSLYEDERYLSEQAEALAGKDLRTADTAIRRRAIRNVLCDFGIEPSGERISETEKRILKGSGKYNLSGDIYAVVKKGTLRIEKIPKERMIFPETMVNIGENRFLCDKKVIISENNREKNEIIAVVNDLVTKNVLDCDKIQGELFLRNRRAGDGYIRANRNFTSSLKKLMNESVPAGKRDLVPILADSEGIVWAEGFGIADRVKPDENTKSFMTVEVKGELF